MSLPSFFLSAFVTFFVLVGPLQLVPLFLAITAKEPQATKNKIAIYGTLIAAAILIGFAIFGNWLLDELHIELASFRIGGGLLLLIWGIEMVFEKKGVQPTSDDEEQANRHLNLSIFPLATPFIAGPAAITAVILFTDPEGYTRTEQLVAILALLSVLFISFLMMRGSAAVSRFVSKGVLKVLSRILGIIIVALSVQMIIQGIHTQFKI